MAQDIVESKDPPKTVPEPADLPSLTQKELDQKIKQHAMYLRGQVGGARAVIQYKDLSGLHLANRDLSQADFTGCLLVNCNLSSSNFSGTTFFACDLRHSDCRDSNFSRCDLRGSYLSGVNMTGANLKEADMREGKIMLRGEGGILEERARSGGEGGQTIFTGAKLSGVNMGKIQAQGADFSDADLTGAHLEEANLSHVNFEGANLTDSDMSAADISFARMRSAIISGIILTGSEKEGVDTTGAILDRHMGERLESLGKSLPELLEEHMAFIESKGKDGSQLDLSGYDLRDVIDLNRYPLTAIKAMNANFLSQNLEEAEMQGAHFDKSDFRDCGLRGADLRGSTFTYAKFSRADLSYAQLCPLEFKNADGTKRLQRVDLSGADLRYCNLSYIDLRDCILMGADLSHAILRGADLRRADFTGALMNGTVLEDVQLDDAVIDITSL